MSEDPERWKRLWSIFDKALERPLEDRAAFLDTACGGDADLRTRVEQLLDSADRNSGFLEAPLYSQAGSLLRQALDELPGDLPEAPSTDSTEASTASLSSSSAAPDIIGPYRLLQKIGEGGMGEVWLAEQTEPVRRRVALKLIKAGMDTKQVVARFEAERQALALMDHPGIARVFDAGETPRGLPYFVMEHVSGEPITAYCDRHRLTTAERLALFGQVCEAVQHAHQKGVIHRDLKPSNVLVAVLDGKPVPKVIDFGVAKATARPLTERTLFTELGVLIGTPEYMSPEQAEMTGLDVDTRTDVYALGVMLYELLTGALPFEPSKLRQAGYDEIRRRIREVDPPRPSTRVSSMGEKATEAARNRRTEPRQLAGRIRGDLDWIVMRALEKDRTRRYGSPADLAADLERHLSHQPVLAGRPGAAYRAKKFVRRHRFGVAVVFLAAAGLVAFSITTAVQARRIARERDRADQEAEVSGRVSDFMVHIFQVSNPSEARGNAVTAREILDKGAEQIEGLGKEPAVQARFLLILGRVYTNLGLYHKAEPLLQRSVELRRRLFGEEHPDTLYTMGALERLYQLEGRYREAQKLAARVLATRRRILGPDHPDTLDSMEQLGVDLERQGLDVEAGKLYAQVLESRRRVLGENNPKTLWAMNNLAGIYRREGRLAEAESMYRDLVQRRRLVSGEDHPATLWVLNNLAGTYKEAGRYKEAEKLYREVLDSRRRVLGEDHPDTLSSMTTLADAYRLERRYELAEPLFRQVLEVRRRTLGPEEPATLGAMMNLAAFYVDKGQLQQGIPLLKKALEGYRRTLGPEDRRTLWAQFNLASAYADDHKLREGERMLEEVLEIQRRTMGKNNPDLYQTLYNLACYAARLGEREKALDYLKKSVDAGFGDSTFMSKDSDLKSLRDTPEFRRLLEVVRGRARK